jgi:NADH-quinone oxidoreductase subunit D
MNSPSLTNLQGLEYLMEGGAIGDMVILIGTIDPVMGEADK